MDQTGSIGSDGLKSRIFAGDGSGEGSTKIRRRFAGDVRTDNSRDASGGVAMGDPLDLDAFDPAAVAAVIALRAIVPESADVPVDRVRVLPSRQVVTDSEAASILAALPKPIHCVPSANGGVLEISCGPVEPRIAPVHQARDPSAGGEWDALPEEVRLIREIGYGDVLVIGRGTEAVTLSPAAFRRFEEEYSLGGSHFQIGDVPEFFGFPRGATTARRYGPSHSRTQVHVYRQ